MTNNREQRTTVLVTLGHDGCPDIPAGRSIIRRILSAYGADLLGRWTDGDGVWQGKVTETCDAWLATIPDENVHGLGVALAYLAEPLGQEALGYVVHDHMRRPLSYVEAAQ